MTKAVLGFGAGLAVGVVATYLVLRGRASSPTTAAAPTPAVTAAVPASGPAHDRTAPAPPALVAPSPTTATADPVPGPDVDPRTIPPELMDRWRMRHHGVSTADEFWDELPPDPTWDGAQTTRVRERLARLGVTVAADAVACRYRCCRVDLTEEQLEAIGDDLYSSVGLGFDDAGGHASAGLAPGRQRETACWRRGGAQHPDRLAERTELLARAAAAVAACGRGQSPRQLLRMIVTIDPDGEIAKVDSNATALGTAAASCAERALIERASFAADDRPTIVPLRVAVGA